MASEFEIQIMADIGFAQHFHHFNGSGDCARIRKVAAEKLSEAIYKRATPGVIASPNQKVVAAVKKVALHGDESNFTLTKTWQAASDAIAAHVSAASLPLETQTRYLDKIAAEIEEHYLPKEHRGAKGDAEDIAVIGDATAQLAASRKNHGLPIFLPYGRDGGGRSIG